MPLEVSVIVPAYNRGRLIRPTLDSIFHQSHPPSEVIVVDDGSTDDTKEVVTEYWPPVKYMRIENSGPPRARNVGAAAAKTEWLAFCDSDDLWHPQKLSLQVQLLERAPDVAYCFTNCTLVENDIWSESTKFDSLPEGYWQLTNRRIEPGLIVVDESMFERLLIRQPIFPSTVMMKKDFFVKVGAWREALGRNPAEDVEFHLRCVDPGPIGVVIAPVVGIRKHEQNFSGNSLRTQIGHAEMLQFVLEHNPVAPQYASVIQERIIDSKCSAAESAFELGELSKMKEVLKAVPYHRLSRKLKIKSAIALFPNGIAQFLRGLTSSRHPGTGSNRVDQP